MPFRKLSGKIFIAVFLGTTINLIAVSIFTFRFTKAALQQSIMASQLELTRQSMDKIDRLLNERCTEILVIAGIKSVEIFLAHSPGEDLKILATNASKRMAEVTPLTGPWDRLLVTDREGKVVLSSDDEEIGKSIKENPEGAKAYENAIQKEIYYSDLVAFDSAGASTIIFSAPVHNTNALGRPVIGTIVGYFSWAAVLQILEDIPGRSAILNHEGRVIGQNTEVAKNNSSFQKITNPRLLQGLKDRRSISMIEPKREDGFFKDVLLSLGVQSGYLSYQGNGWGLVLESPTRVAFAPATRAAAKLVFILIPIILLTSIPILLLIFRWVNRPIAILTQTTREIAAGNLTKQVPVFSRDEMGELASSFNTMTERLRKSHENLETQVKERTLELSKTVKDLESEMKRRTELEGIVLQSEKMAAIGQLAGGVAHEINNPLGVILGFSQNVVKRIKPGDPFEMPLKSIEREAIRCKNLVQDLLTFSRLGKTEKESVDIKEAIEGALSLVLAQSKVKNVDLVKEFAEVPKVIANRNQIQQVIINLSNNAMDAMPNGGRLTIRVQKAKIENRDSVEIQVGDTGQGIPAEIRSKIFNPFFTTKEIGKGTGLGLSLVYEIIQKHNGRILLDSEVGKGSTFRIALPLTEKASVRG